MDFNISVEVCLNYFSYILKMPFDIFLFIKKLTYLETYNYKKLCFNSYSVSSLPSLHQSPKKLFNIGISLHFKCDVFFFFLA